MFEVHNGRSAAENNSAISLLALNNAAVALLVYSTNMAVSGTGGLSSAILSVTAGHRP